MVNYNALYLSLACVLIFEIKGMATKTKMIPHRAMLIAIVSYTCGRSAMSEGVYTGIRIFNA